MEQSTFIAFIFLVISTTHALYRRPTIVTVIPKTNDNLKRALCSSVDVTGICNDNTPKLIILDRIFDFRNTEGIKTEPGCYHLSTRECIAKGQKKLNVNNQCQGLTTVSVRYDAAGITPLIVGPNKYIVSRRGGLRGKGLKVCKNQNVAIVGLSITDINPGLIWGGDAIILDGSSNVLIHGNYISRIGRQMIAIGFGKNRGVVISNNEFDGRTPYSAFCDGYHYWLWLFLGADDTITLYNNFVHHTSGRGPHITGMHQASVRLHMVRNRFENINHDGLVDAPDPTARILMEGNSFTNVSSVIHGNNGHIYFPLYNKAYSAACRTFFNRGCLLNTAVNSGGLTVRNDFAVLREMSIIRTINTTDVDAINVNFIKYKYHITNNLLNLLTQFKAW